jgi:hypothetical protein
MEVLPRLKAIDEPSLLSCFFGFLSVRQTAKQDAKGDLKAQYQTISHIHNAGRAPCGMQGQLAFSPTLHKTG